MCAETAPLDVITELRAARVVNRFLSEAFVAMSSIRVGSTIKRVL